MFEQELFKVCPECGGEYRLDVERCHDCEVPLVYPEEIARRDARELRSSPDLVALRTAPIAWVRALAADLDRRAIRYRIDRRRAREEGLLTLYVRRQDRDAAAAVDAERARIDPPFEPEEAALEGSAWEEEEPRPAEPEFKTCPRCGGEYRLEAERCADCGGELVLSREVPAGSEEEEAGEEPEAGPDAELPFDRPRYELPPSDDLVCVCCHGIRSLQTLSVALDEARIAHRLDPAPFGEPGVGCLYTRPEDGDAAAAVDAGLSGAPLAGAELPDEVTTCPACGTAHSPQDLECPGCGLGLPVPMPERTCSQCGAVIWVAAARCPSCAAVLPES